MPSKGRPLFSNMDTRIDLALAVASFLAIVIILLWIGWQVR